jgi:hypothetical protein
MRESAWRSQTFANDGGPLIAFPHELVGHWPGTRSDYDRACDARQPFDFFPAGPGLLVVAGSTDTLLYEVNWLRVGGQADRIPSRGGIRKTHRPRFFCGASLARAVAFRGRPRGLSVGGGGGSVPFGRSSSNSTHDTPSDRASAWT